MRKKAVLSFTILICFFCIWHTKSSSYLLQMQELDAYCKNNSTCNAKKFYMQKIDNYYFAVSVGGTSEKSDELMIFRQIAKEKDEFEVFGGYRPVKTKQRAVYSWYESTFPDYSGKSIGSSRIIFSSNEEKICKGVISMKENGVTKKKVYEINPNKAFVIKIDQLGKIDHITRDIAGVRFYDRAGEEVAQYRKK